MRKNNLFGFLFFLLLIFIGLSVSAQKKSKSLIQLSGVVVTGDSAQPVAFVNISVKHTGKGTISDFFGFFSIPVQPKDTLEFSSVGYKKSRTVIPDTIKGNHYSIIKLLRPDTILLKTAVIYPWPPLEQFKQIFLAKKIPDDALERAKKNLDKADLKSKFDHFAMDGSMNFRNNAQLRTDRLYYAGQYPPNKLLDPFAWAQFIKALKNGELKRKMD